MASGKYGSDKMGKSANQHRKAPGLRTLFGVLDSTPAIAGIIPGRLVPSREPGARSSFRVQRFENDIISLRVVGRHPVGQLLRLQLAPHATLVEVIETFKSAGFRPR